MDTRPFKRQLKINFAESFPALIVAGWDCIGASLATLGKGSEEPVDCPNLRAAIYKAIRKAEQTAAPGELVKVTFVIGRPFAEYRIESHRIGEQTLWFGWEWTSGRMVVAEAVSFAVCVKALPGFGQLVAEKT